MDGIHDLGGKHGYGKVQREEEEPAFHGRWEAAVFSFVAASIRAGALNCADRFRHAIERIDPVAYLSHGYYGRWLGGIETLLVEAGVVDSDQITNRAMELGADERDLIAARPSEQPDPPGEMADQPTAARDTDAEPQFRTGDVVVTSTVVKPGHTRLPAYARGRRGTVVAHHGGWVFPDTNAHGQGENPTHLYTVKFTGEELWGAGADLRLTVHLDLFEPYLTLAEDRL